MPGAVAGALVALVSAAVLVLEIVAVRLVAPYVGLTLQTYTAAIGVSLGGIALGAAVGGRLADRVAPTRLLGPLLGLGGGLLMLTRPLVLLLGPRTGVGPLAVIVLAAVAVLPPAVVLSAVPPAVVKARLTGLSDAGTVVGRLSALGTLGALVGTFVTGFVLLGAFGTGVILLATGAVCLLAAVATVLLVSGAAAGRDMLVLVVGAGLLGTGFAALPGRCQEETAYYCVSVHDAPAGRTLVLDDLRHAVVADDPTVLALTYVRRIGDLVDTAGPPGAPLDVLHLGGGGFTLPRYVSATRPGSRNLVVELDPASSTSPAGGWGWSPAPTSRSGSGTPGRPWPRCPTTPPTWSSWTPSAASRSPGT